MGSHFGVLSPAHQVQPLTLPQSAKPQSKLNAAMGDHHPDARLGQASASACGVRGRPRGAASMGSLGQQWGPQEPPSTGPGSGLCASKAVSAPCP